MDRAGVMAVLAYEYGWLDAKHCMGYTPRNPAREYVRGYTAYRQIRNSPQPPGQHEDEHCNRIRSAN